MWLFFLSNLAMGASVSGVAPPVPSTTPNTMVFNKRAFNAVAFNGSIVTPPTIPLTVYADPRQGSILF